MIDTLHIQSFKSIVDAKLDLGQVNVFIGANGSGKSNLLEAMAVLSSAASGKVDQSTLVWRGARASSYYRPMFDGIDDDALTKFSASSGKVSYEVELAAPKMHRLLSWQYRSEKLQYESRLLVDRGQSKLDPEVGYAALKLAEIDPESPASVALKAIAGYSIYSPDTPVLHGWISDPQEREPVGLSGGRLAEAINEMMGKGLLCDDLHKELQEGMGWFGGFGIFEPGKREPEDIRGRALVFVDQFFSKLKGLNFLSPNDVNEGVLYMAFLAVLGLHPLAPASFAVENVDHGLNPLLAKRLMTSLSQQILSANAKRQAFLTTHNPLVLDGLPLQDDRVRLFTVDRDNNGRTVVGRFEVTDKHREMAGKGWTLSRMWINKLIGGVPDV